MPVARGSVHAMTGTPDEACAGRAGVGNLGPWPGELYDVTSGNIVDHGSGLQVTLDRTNARGSPVLVPSVPYVRRWLDDRPGVQSDPLWCLSPHRTASRPTASAMR